MKKLVLLLCIAFAPLAHAQGDRGMYFGAGIGAFDYDEGPEGISDTNYEYHLFGGYKVLESFAIELELGGTGSLEETFVDNGPFGPININVDATLAVYKLTFLGILPFDAISLFAGAGYYSAGLEADINVEGFGDQGTIDFGHERGATATFGLQHDFGLDLKSLSIRGQYEWYDFPDGIDATGVTIAVLFRF
jgi:hypothetical protein